MAIWLWVIGITAIIWPVIVTHIVEGHLDGRINEVSKSSQGKITSDFQVKSAQHEIRMLQETVEQQDALITALWQKTLGFDDGEDAYSALKLPEYLGVKPQWRAHQSEWAGPVHYLARYEPYPWGTHAENLNFPE